MCAYMEQINAIIYHPHEFHAQNIINKRNIFLSILPIKYDGLPLRSTTLLVPFKCLEIRHHGHLWGSMVLLTISNWTVEQVKESGEQRAISIFITPTRIAWIHTNHGELCKHGSVCQPGRAPSQADDPAITVPRAGFNFDLVRATRFCTTRVEDAQSYEYWNYYRWRRV